MYDATMALCRHPRHPLSSLHQRSSPLTLLRTQELESLLDKGVITEDAYDSIHTLLPAEGTLGRRNAEAATPASSSSTPAPADDLANLSINDNHATPPSYAQSNPGATAGSRPPPPPPPTKPVLCHARALYAYPGSDVRDCAFERDDRIAVHE